MYKSICVVVVLLAAFAFISGSKPAGASAPISYASPQIVARGRLMNQTSPIPTKTILTPTQDGLYRLSAYATVAKPDPSSQSTWQFGLQWTDDAGSGQLANSSLVGYGCCAGEFDWENSFPIGGVTVVIEAKAGTPVTYSVIQAGLPDSSAYSLYYTLERLE